MKQLSIISLLLCLFWGCQDAIEEPASGEAGDLTGQVVQFGGYLPGGIATRAAEPYTDYSRMSQAYTLRVTMKQEGETTSGTTALYTPKSTDEEANQGLLLPKEGQTPLYWPNSVTACGFTATAGSDALAADQSAEAKWLEQDRLEGYAAVPEAATSEGATTPSYVVPETEQYKTHKEWYQANRTWRDDLGLTTADKYKVVPLFMKHQRAWISVILKAGEGVKADDLDYEKTLTSLTAEIYSYTTAAAAEEGEATTTTALKVSPWKRAEEVDYEGTVGKKPSTRLEAIVQPFDYGTAVELPICVLNLSNMKYSFYAKNDSRAKDESQKWKDDYNLTAGKHLVITVTLSNDRKVLITSYLKDWKVEQDDISSDDYGNQSPPIQIPSVEMLRKFLDTDTYNAAGQMGVITQSLDLSGEAWKDYTLKATLNLAGNTLTLNNQPLLKDMESSATLTNGQIKVKGIVQAAVCVENSGTVDRIRVDEENPAACARQAGLVATNHGFITSCSSNLKVAGDYEGDTPTAYDGTKMLYIGGIAGVSIPKEGQTTVPTISHCTVTARVDLSPAIKKKVGEPIGENIVNGKPFTPLHGWKNGRICGGGIVGAATGIVSDNKFEYGITLLTNSYVEGQVVHFRNIVYKEATEFTERKLRAESNEWPTNVRNHTTPKETEITNARAASLLYDGVINSQSELQALVWENSLYNVAGKRYRVAESFTVFSDKEHSENGIGWQHGKKSNILDNAYRGNVLFELDGNDMTITLDGKETIEYKNSKNEGTPLSSNATAPMLFINITGKIHDLTVHCAKSLYGIPVYNEQTGANELTDICSPLGYALVGGELKNVKVTAAKDVFIQAAVAAGMVCWAKGGATMTNCESSVGVKLFYGTDLPSSALRYAGGLVAQAGRATLTNCRYVSPEELTGGNLICINKKNPNKPTGDGTVYIGGIVGGTVVESAEAASAELPSLVMTDCSSWYEQGLEKVSNGTTTKGSIIGRSNYAPSRDELEQGVHDCKSNWWPVGKAGVGTWTQGEGLTEETVIGRRNGVIPAKPVTVN